MELNEQPKPIPPHVPTASQAHAMEDIRRPSMMNKASSKGSFRPTEDRFDKLAAWVHYPELPVEYNDKEALHSIASKVGKPIRVDYATNNLTRARYARVCVEIMLEKPILTRVWVGNHWQAIIYENLHILCFHWGRIGHQKAQCAGWKDESLRSQAGVEMLMKDTSAVGRSLGQVLHDVGTLGVNSAPTKLLTNNQMQLCPNG